MTRCDVCEREYVDIDRHERTKKHQDRRDDRIGDALAALFWQHNAVAVDEEGNYLGIVGR